MEVLYLVRGATLKCMFGSKEGKLNLPESHGSYILNQPIICEEDCKPFINIPSFGICKLTNMPCIPVILGKWLCAHKQTQITISPVTATPSAVVAPAAITATLPAANTTPPAINTKPAVTTDSALFCGFGGLILPQDSGQEEILQLLANFPKEELLNLLMGLKSGSPYSKEPVNLSTGNFVFEKEDISIIGTFPLNFKRTYNSLDNRRGIFGYHWTHNHEMFLEDKGDIIEILVEDGCIQTYYKKAENLFLSSGGIFNILKKEAVFYLFITSNQTQFTFNKKGECIEKKDANRHITYYNYEGGRLISIIHITGMLFLKYNQENQLICITDHVGRKVKYSYNTEDLLESVQNVQGNFYYYHYDTNRRLIENKNPLGITTVKNEFDELGRTTKQTFADGGVMLYDYDNERVIITEQNKNHIKYYRDEKFHNIKTVCQDGYEVTEYNDQNLRTYFKDKNGNEYHYKYNENGKLICKINPLGHKIKIEYNKDGLPTRIIQYNNSTIQYKYDQNGNIIEQINPLDGKVTYQYNKNGLPKYIYRADNSQLEVFYDDKGNIIKIIDESGFITEYIYDELNRMIEFIDGNRNKTCYEYDQYGSITKIINPAGDERIYEYNKNGKVIKIINFDGNTILQEYNELNCLSKIIDAKGRKTELKYDLSWNIRERIQANEAKISFFYNKMNKLEKVINELGALFEYKYDGNGNLIKEILPGGRQYQYKYNEVNLIIEMEEPNGAKTRIDYDSMGNITEITNAMGNKTKIQYNAVGLKTKQIDVIGNETYYFYNELGLITKITEPLGKTTYYEYLPGGWLSKIVHPDKTYMIYEYDRNHNIISKRNQAGYCIFYTYDCLDRIIKICDSYGTENFYAYDSVGNITSITDSNGNITKYWYSPVGELIQVEDALGNQCKYEYDALGNLIILEKCDKLEQKQKNITFYQRNLIGQIIAIQDPLGNKEQFAYDETGYLKEKIDREGNKTSYIYNRTGNVERITYADGDFVQFHYNSLKQLIQIEDWIGMTQIENDPLGRIKKVTDYKGRELFYEWNEAGKIKQLIYPDQTTIKYDYDCCGRLSHLIEKNKIIQYAYDQNGYLKSMALPNGILTTYQYDKKGYLLKLDHRCNQEWLDSYQYQYDKMGNKIQIAKSRKGLPKESGNYTYQYDALNRLIKVSKEGKEESFYQYDTFGNRSLLKGLDKEIFYIYNVNNQLIQSEENGEKTEYQYDKRGNLIRVLKEGECKLAYEYNVRNQLSRTWNKNAPSAIYEYNGLGYRVKKQSAYTEKENKMVTIYRAPDFSPYIGKIKEKFLPQKQVEYIVDFTRTYHNLLMKEEEGVSQHFLWDGEVISTTKEGKTGYYCQDELGSPIRLLWDTGQEETYGYDEFGKDLYSNLNNQQPFGYTGYQREEENPFYFAQARYYDPQNGRFVQEDAYKGSLRNSLTLNGYSYCQQNPLTYIDLCGYWPTWKQVRDKAAKAADTISNVWDDVTNSKPWKVVSAGGGIIVGTVSVIGGAYLIPEGGIGWWGVAHGVNSVYNGIKDITYMVNGEWDKVGTENFLKDNLYEPLPEAIGELMGTVVDTITNDPNNTYTHEIGNIGKTVGDIVFYGFDIHFSVQGFNEGIKVLSKAGKVQQWPHLYEVGNIMDGYKQITHIDYIEDFTKSDLSLSIIKVVLNAKGIIDDTLGGLIVPSLNQFYDYICE